MKTFVNAARLLIDRRESKPALQQGLRAALDVRHGGVLMDSTFGNPRNCRAPIGVHSMSTLPDRPANELLRTCRDDLACKRA